MPYKIPKKYRVTEKFPDDLSGLKFGSLMVISFHSMNKHNQGQYFCKCDCGNERIILGACLKSNQTKSCGCRKYITDKLPPNRRSRKHSPIVCGIYKISNPKDEVYIGGSRTIYRRWLRHREARKKIKIHLSIKEYGWKQHKFEIIHELPSDVSDEVLIRYEQLYMDSYRDCGCVMLNVKDAGSKAKFSEESKQNMSIAQRNRRSVVWNKGLKGGNAMAAQYKLNKLNNK